MQYLISVENLKKNGLIHSNVDTKILTVAIKRVQDMNIQPVLGSPLYRALLNRVATDTWTAVYRTLMNDYVVPALVAWVDYKACLLLHEKLTNKTVGRVQDENITANTNDENYYLRDELKKDAMFYMERLVGFLKDDCGDDYPEYTAPITRTNHDLKKDRDGYTYNWIT